MVNGSLSPVRVARMTELSPAAERRRSLRIVQTAFAAIAGAALLAGLAFHSRWIGGGLPAEDIAAVSRAFLILAVADTVMLFAWERLFPAAR